MDSRLSSLKDQIDLLLTDMVLPDGLTGRQLAEKLLAEKPGLKILYTSGHSADLLSEGFALRAGISFLQKPYRPPTLLQTMRECLDACS